jgi:pimeloyl-ACP methyl ester carboxylesterase
MRRWVSTMALAGAVGLMASATAAAADAPKGTTIVLVHGAFAESASWNGVITDLVAHGYPVIAAANPLRSVKGDAAYVAGIVKSIGGPVVLVGHSYGGTVISLAADGNDNVKALVFVSGLAPDAGETASDLVGHFAGSTLAETLAPPVPQADGGKDIYIRESRYPAQFAADVPLREAVQMAATQRPIAESALNEPLAGPPAWKALPSWFIYGSLDKNIPPAVHAFMAKRANARQVLEIEGASHVVMISHPHAVATLIEQAASAQ